MFKLYYYIEHHILEMEMLDYYILLDQLDTKDPFGTDFLLKVFLHTLPCRVPQRPKQDLCYSSLENQSSEGLILRSSYVMK
jgi:hypothetical protein